MGPSAESSMEEPGYKGARRHNDLCIVAGHIPRLRSYMAVHGRCRLDALAECNDALGGAECPLPG